MKYGSWALCVFLGCLILAACDRAPAPQHAPKEVPLALQAASLTRLEVFKGDARTGERWNAAFTRPAVDSRSWRIESSPGGDLGDRLAASGLINHLLDTFTTLQIRELAPRATPASFGLEPPEMGVRLDHQEIRIGAPVTHAGSAKGTRYAQLPPDPTVYVIEGAALQMLDHIDSFQSLRQQAWLGELDSDDIDEIEVLEGPAGRKSLYYAQREGSTWTDRKHRPVGRAQELLDHLAHARVQEFVDAPAPRTEILAGLGKRPGLEVRLTRRGGTSVIRLAAAWVVVSGTESAYGTVDSREGQVFRIHPETLRLLETFREKSRR